jgi:hypothetical protein
MIALVADARHYGAFDTANELGFVSEFLHSVADLLDFWFLAADF